MFLVVLQPRAGVWELVCECTDVLGSIPHSVEKHGSCWHRWLLCASEMQHIALAPGRASLFLSLSLSLPLSLSLTLPCFPRFLLPAAYHSLSLSLSLPLSALVGKH